MAKYCFINLIQFDEDVCNKNGNNGYKNAMSFIASGSHDFILLGKNDTQYIGYMSKVNEHELISTKFVPFIFIYYPEECKFVDTVTGIEFPYKLADKSSVREFTQDSGGFGQYIKAVESTDVDESLPTDMDSYIKTIDLDEYKNELNDLVELVLEGYKTFYEVQRGIQRTRDSEEYLKKHKNIDYRCLEERK